MRDLAHRIEKLEKQAQLGLKPLVVTWPRPLRDGEEPRQSAGWPEYRLNDWWAVSVLIIAGQKLTKTEEAKWIRATLADFRKREEYAKPYVHPAEVLPPDPWALGPSPVRGALTDGEPSGPNLPVRVSHAPGAAFCWCPSCRSAFRIERVAVIPPSPAPDEAPRKE